MVIVSELFRKRREILRFLRYIRSSGGISGTVDNEEFDHLIGLAKQSRAFGGPLVEIGTLFGLSTQALALGKSQE